MFYVMSTFTMLVEVLHSFYPGDWTAGNIPLRWNFEEVTLSPDSMDYLTLKLTMMGGFATDIKKITRVQNPYIYGSFLLKKAEYESRGIPVSIVQLYHDTGESKVNSILSTNLDWRLVRRSKYGSGVSFSSSTAYANKYSSMYNGTDRAMIVADVLVGHRQHTECSNTLPLEPCDTSIGNKGQVYVKYYDNEFYPKYVIYYNSIQHYRRRGYRFF